MDRQYQSVKSYLNNNNAHNAIDADAFFQLVAGPEAHNLKRGLFGRTVKLNRATLLDLLKLAENIYADTAYMQVNTIESSRHFATLMRMRNLLLNVQDEHFRNVLASIVARIENLLRSDAVNDVEITVLSGDFYEEYSRYATRQYVSTDTLPPPPPLTPPIPETTQAFVAPSPPPAQAFVAPSPPPAQAFVAPSPPPAQAFTAPSPQPTFVAPPSPQPTFVAPSPQATQTPSPRQTFAAPSPVPAESPQPTRAFPTPEGTLSRGAADEFEYFAGTSVNGVNLNTTLKPPVPPKPAHLSRPNFMFVGDKVTGNTPPPPNGTSPQPGVNVPPPPVAPPLNVMPPPPPPNVPPPPPLDNLLLDAMMSEPRKGATDRSALFDQIKMGATLKKAQPVEPPSDLRGDMLNQIRTGATLRKTGRLEDENLGKPKKGREGILGVLYNTLGSRRGGIDSERSDVATSESTSGFDESADTRADKASKSELKHAAHLYNFAKDSKLYNIQKVNNSELTKILENVGPLLKRSPRTAENVEKANAGLYLFRQHVTLPKNALDAQPAPELYAADAPQFYVQIEDLLFAGRYDDARAFIQAVDAPEDMKLKKFLTVANQLSTRGQ
ncbi:viral capsid associated protein [Choristoneura fumiferana DEF multiple nucleopolyhedrovirus]|uniref:Viral capsid associated protein n=1 Tax=Choristoneura fumiferana defective polyhedrosis virus TaxID=74660 RepID=Q6VTY8_NPVCD|nr:viral capsid associated protein [Choristoneura fumiferana DEF multiple nucleopolyhedrovirus]AAQ91783.1 viral capsid associated protein [Choristoneura fumiferana DEF multiple nucleopolyhedrovirus]